MNHLKPYQIKILKECLQKKNGGLSIPMGSGKTLIAILLGLELTDELKDYILIVCSKSLISTWEFEIKKFFDKDLKYQILYNNINSFELEEGTRIILTTTEVISGQYNANNLHTKLIIYENTTYINSHLPIITKRYINPTKPLCDDTNILFGRTWGCLIVDEVQNYTNIDTKKCQGLISIFAKHRWVLSGTMFSEPKVERILGYYSILDIKNTPRTVPSMKNYISSYEFKGLKETTVSRKVNEMFVMPKINKIIISNKLTFEEAQLYISIKNTLNKISKKAKKSRIEGDTVGSRRFNSYLLAIITYLRQSLVCPLIPISNVAIDMVDYEKKSELSLIFNEELGKLNLGQWLNSEDSVKGSRIIKILEIIDKHPNERIIIFSAFRTTLDMVNYFIKNRETFTISSKMNLKQRGEVQIEFEESKSGILLLTYEIGGSGLNLQCASKVLLIDFFWNGNTTKQAIARVLRYGQEENVDIYYFTSNTGIEKAVFEKQINKFEMICELEDGPTDKKIPVMKTEDIIKILNSEDNTRLLEDILKF